MNSASFLSWYPTSDLHGHSSPLSERSLLRCDTDQCHQPEMEGEDSVYPVNVCGYVGGWVCEQEKPQIDPAVAIGLQQNALA